MRQQLASPDLPTLQAPAKAPYGLSLREAAEIVEFPEAVALAARHLDVPMLNRVVGLGLAEPVSESLMESIDTLYRGAGVRYLVQVSPTVASAEQAVLRRSLEAGGLVRTDNWAKLLRDVAPPREARTDLRITPAGAEHAGVVAELLNAAFETPPEFGWLLATLVGRYGWWHYLAWDGEQPVAVGVLFVHGQVGALEGAATLPAFRGRGAQNALMARRIVDAAALGCRWLITETGEDTPGQPNPSYRNTLRAGFQLVYQRPNWVYFPPPNHGNSFGGRVDGRRIGSTRLPSCCALCPRGTQAALISIDSARVGCSVTSDPKEGFRWRARISKDGGQVRLLHAPTLVVCPSAGTG